MESVKGIVWNARGKGNMNPQESSMNKAGTRKTRLPLQPKTVLDFTFATADPLGATVIER